MKLFACKNFVGTSTVDYTDHGVYSFIYTSVVLAGNWS